MWYSWQIRGIRTFLDSGELYTKVGGIFWQFRTRLTVTLKQHSPTLCTEVIICSRFCFGRNDNLQGRGRKADQWHKLETHEETTRCHNSPQCALDVFAQICGSCSRVGSSVHRIDSETQSSYIHLTFTFHCFLPTCSVQVSINK